MKPRTKTLAQIFRIPIIVTVVSLAGLIIALLMEGPADIAAAAAAAVPIVAIVWALFRRD